MTGERRAEWYVLIHNLPPKPPYLRSKVRTLLAAAGAVPLKDSVYLLPFDEAHEPALRRISADASAGGGHAYLCRGAFVLSPHDRLVEMFREARERDYRELVESARAWTAELEQRSGARPPEGRVRVKLGHAERRLDALRRIDFFEAPGRHQAEAALAAVAARLAARRPKGGPHRELVGRTWVTRRGIQVDRIASAWLLRRFVDPGARFRFIDAHDYERREGELRFDMADAEFTHEGDRCTVETLVLRLGLRDPALASVAEIVHDIDIKDGKFGRPEAKGVERLLRGMLVAHPGDAERLDKGFALMDDLYRSFSVHSRGKPHR